MLAHARAELPNECCGLCGGDPATGTITHVYRLVNTAASPTRYFAEVKSLLAAFRAMREHGTHLLAIYHSHPTSDPIPSRTDLEQNFYGPDVAHVIIAMNSAEPIVRAWSLGEGAYREELIQYVE